MFSSVHKSRLSLAHIAAVLCFISPAVADIVTLVDGTKLEGEIVTQTDDLLILRTKVGGIWDERRLPLGEVSSIEKESLEAKAWKDAKVSLPTPDLLPRADYEEMIEKRLKPFLNEFPSGEHSAKANEQLAVLQSELEKVIAGEVKFNGVWMSADEYSDRKYWIDSERLLRDLKSSADRGSLVTALRRFDDLETSYPDSVSYALAVSEIRAVLEKYDRELSTAIVRAPGLVEQRTEMLSTLSQAERIRTESEIERSDKEAKARMDKERADKVKWLTPYPYDEKMLKSIQSTVRKEMERIADLEPAVLERRAGVLESIDSAINEGRLEKAQQLIAEHSELLKRSNHLRALETKLKELIEEREKAATIDTTDPEVDGEGVATDDDPKQNDENTEEDKSTEESPKPNLSDAEKRKAEAAETDKEVETTASGDSAKSDDDPVEVAADEEKADEPVETAKPVKEEAPRPKPEVKDEEGISPLILGVLVALVLILVGAVVASVKGRKKGIEEE